MPPWTLWVALLAAGCGSSPGLHDAAAEAALDAAAEAVSDGPSRLFLTVDELPDYLNGSLPYHQADGVPHPFHVRVNRANFTIELSGASTAARVTCDQPFTLGGATID